MGGIGNHHIFRIGTRFHAKATADIANDDTHLFCRQAQQVADQSAHTSWHLATHTNDQAPSFCVGQDTARLNRHGHQALVMNI